MSRPNVFRSCRVRDIMNVKPVSFVLYCDRHFGRHTVTGNVDVFSNILMISVNDGVCQGFP